VSVTASFGVAVLDTASMPGPEDLLRAADTALYSSKGRGRNRVSISDAGLDSFHSDPVGDSSLGEAAPAEHQAVRAEREREHADAQQRQRGLPRVSLRCARP
jgi:predicted signal transduction protein with EAL and GGDEF domain